MEKRGPIMGTSLVAGVSIGVLVGAVTGNVSFSVAIGTAIGILAGTVFAARRESQKSRKVTAATRPKKSRHLTTRWS